MRRQPPRGTASPVAAPSAPRPSGLPSPRSFLPRGALQEAACANASLDLSTPNCIFAGTWTLCYVGSCQRLRILCCVIVSIGLACSCLFQLCSLHDPVKAAKFVGFRTLKFSLGRLNTCAGGACWSHNLQQLQVTSPETVHMCGETFCLQTDALLLTFFFFQDMV